MKRKPYIGRPWPAKLSDTDRAEIRSLRKRGLKFREIAERYSIVVSTVAKVLNQAPRRSVD